MRKATSLFGLLCVSDVTTDRKDGFYSEGYGKRADAVGRGQMQIYPGPGYDSARGGVQYGAGAAQAGIIKRLAGQLGGHER